MRIHAPRSALGPPAGAKGVAIVGRAADDVGGVGPSQPPEPCRSGQLGGCGCALGRRLHSAAAAAICSWWQAPAAERNCNSRQLAAGASSAAGGQLTAETASAAGA
eukprot:361635-Chlamydomonas_euryale.AAC.3